MGARAVSLAAAACLDRALGEPPAAFHPVVLIGRALSVGTDRHRGSTKVAQLLGGAVALGCVGTAAVAAAWAVERIFDGGALRWLGRGAALKPMFAVRMLLREAESVALALEARDLDLARQRLRSLVSRPAAGMSSALIAAAAIESLAENLGDSVVAPWLYFAGFGLPGAAVYRVVNTADSMYGYRGDTEWLGKAAARSDDLLNWLPSRLAAAAIVGAARLRLGSATAASALDTWQADAGATASPNAGQPMAAMAGALRRRLEKRDHYVLGERFPEPTAADIRRALDLTSTASWIALGAMIAGLVARR